MDVHFRNTDVVVEREQGSNARMIMKTVMDSPRGLSLNMWEPNIMLGTGATLRGAYLHAPKTKTMEFRAFQISSDQLTKGHNEDTTTMCDDDSTIDGRVMDTCVNNEQTAISMFGAFGNATK